MEINEKTYTGTVDENIQEYEVIHRKISRDAAAEGMVLLKNNNKILPINKNEKIALYGVGAEKTVKGGLGSGGVNERYSVSIYEGLKNAGYTITTEKWIRSYSEAYDKKMQEWKNAIWEKFDKHLPSIGFFQAYATTVFEMPPMEIPENSEADIAVYVISRMAGEGKDRKDEPGDYRISVNEQAMLERISKLHSKVLLVINSGGYIDLSFVEEYENIDGILLVGQPGCEGGNAVADIISGKLTPSGKLTDTYTYHYSDYPCADTFSYRNGNLDKEKYEEDIYVGYRYFDTFEKPVLYSFGYGLSYTSFEIKTEGIKGYNFGTNAPEIGVQCVVHNTGNEYAGKEVVQIYASCPQKKLAKEYRRLVGYTKTGMLKPGDKEHVEVRFPLYGLASFDENNHEWIMEEGIYGIFAGNSLNTSEFVYAIQVKDDCSFYKLSKVCPALEEIKKLTADVSAIEKRRAEWMEQAQNNIALIVCSKDFITPVTDGKTHFISEETREIVDSLSQEQLIKMVTGEFNKDAIDNIGSSGIMVPGTASQTSGCVDGVLPAVMADGPAGLRILKHYYVNDGKIIVEEHANLEGGFLVRQDKEPEGQKYYQYCTAFPIGMLIAQSWNLDIAKKVGVAIAEEMKHFHINYWLAPGMNIHRNPLCGRNFEYYSEDPVVTGKTASAVAGGVQSLDGCIATLKHFCCNNQEDNRKGVDEILSERALREIYLKGFEMAIREANPGAVMTSYNLVNGVHTANSFDLCTQVLRCEWGFRGVVMTDWGTTSKDPTCTAAGCIKAGNDLIMPGNIEDHENIRNELESGSLDVEDLRMCVGRFIENRLNGGNYIG